MAKVKRYWNKTSRRYKKLKRINAKNTWRHNKVPFDEPPTITTTKGSTQVHWRKGDYIGAVGCWVLSYVSYKEAMGIR